MAWQRFVSFGTTMAILSSAAIGTSPAASLRRAIRYVADSIALNNDAASSIESSMHAYTEALVASSDMVCNMIAIILSQINMTHQQSDVAKSHH